MLDIRARYGVDVMALDDEERDGWAAYWLTDPRTQRPGRGHG